MAVKLNSAGGGSVTLDSPSTASNYTVTLPSAAGTLATTTGTGSVFTNPTINGFTGDTSAITIGTTQFVKDASGNIGIGTASPSNKLVVSNGGAAGIELGPVNGDIFTYNRSTSAYTDMILTAANITLRSNGGSNTLKLDASGNLGLGRVTNANYRAVIRGIGTSSSTAGLVVENGVGTETFFLNDSGNLGLGVTPSAWVSNRRALQLGGGYAVLGFAGTSASSEIITNAYWNTSGQLTRVAASYVGYMDFNNYASGGFTWQIGASGAAGTTVTPTQAMTLTASGDLFVGDTSSPTAARVMSKNTVGQFCYVSNAANQSGGYYHITFLQAGTQVGSITSTGTTTTYSTTSDQRLKTDLGPATETSVIDNTVIHDFEWKSDGIKCRGVFAQEAVVVNPNAVNQGISDELNADGLPVHPWGVDYSKYVPDLIVYCQQLKAQNNALEARLAKLEAK